MAYFRCSEISDIYVYMGAGGLSVSFAMGIPRVVKLMEEKLLKEERVFETVTEGLSYIISLRSLGFQFPQEALYRLLEESWKYDVSEKYKKQVEKYNRENE